MKDMSCLENVQLPTLQRPVTSIPRMSSREEPTKPMLNPMIAALVKMPPQTNEPEVQSGPYLDTSTLLVEVLGKNGTRRTRSEKKPIPDEQKDARYYERRKRNNMAAKKSRDQRKFREDALSGRANVLEKENAVLRAQVSTLREELASLNTLLVRKRLNEKRRREGMELKRKLAEFVRRNAEEILRAREREENL